MLIAVSKITNNIQCYYCESVVNTIFTPLMTSLQNAYMAFFNKLESGILNVSFVSLSFYSQVGLIGSYLLDFVTERLLVSPCIFFFLFALMI